MAQIAEFTSLSDEDENALNRLRGSEGGEPVSLSPKRIRLTSSAEPRATTDATAIVNRQSNAAEGV